MSAAPDSDLSYWRSIRASVDEQIRAAEERAGIVEPQTEIAGDGRELPPLSAYETEPGARKDNGSKTQTTREPRKLHGINFADMRAHLSDSCTVQGLIKPGTLVAIIGASGCGKTFFATNLALHIASGTSWCGRKVKGGLVVYAALEGPASAENRFVAARNSGGFAPGTTLRLTPGPINLRDRADVALLIAFISASEVLYGQKCVDVFVDTLSRAIAGGDENGPEDMGALIDGADAVRLATGAVVTLVHHLGKDETRGGRGHSSLKAALDTEIQIVSQGDIKIATVTKQRDLREGERFAFKLRVVELGLDDEQEPVTTCLVVDMSTTTPMTAGHKQQPTGKNQRLLLAALQEWKRAHPDSDIVSSIDLREIAKAQGIKKKSAFDEAIKPMQGIWLTLTVGGYRFDSQDIL